MKKSLLLAIVTMFLLNSCDKEDVTPDILENNEEIEDVTPTITFGDMDAGLFAVTSQTSNGFTTLNVNTGVALFLNDGKNVDAGTVSLEESDLTKYSNNSYTLTPSMSNPTGVVFDESIDWNVTGGNGFSAFSESITSDFPSATAVTSSENVVKSQGYTLTVDEVNNADSVLFSVGNVYKVLSGESTSYSFSSSELASLQKGTQIVSVAPYSFVKKEIDGKNIYFVNEFVVQKNVTIQE